MKLYSLTHGVKNWADCLKLAWVNEKKRASDEDTKNAEKEAMEASLAEPARRSVYDDDLSIPTSAYYTNNNKGRFGSHYVGD